jgi:hypothetical protein
VRIGGSLADQIPAFKKGNGLISIRALSVIAVVDMNKKTTCGLSREPGHSNTNRPSSAATTECSSTTSVMAENFKSLSLPHLLNALRGRRKAAPSRPTQARVHPTNGSHSDYAH